jgi:hypothetical protein
VCSVRDKGNIIIGQLSREGHMVAVPLKLSRRVPTPSSPRKIDRGSTTGAQRWTAPLMPLVGGVAWCRLSRHCDMDCAPLNSRLFRVSAPHSPDYKIISRDKRFRKLRSAHDCRSVAESRFFFKSDKRTPHLSAFSYN